MKTDAYGRFIKDEPGSHKLERKRRHDELKAHERHEMEAAKARDSHKCRVPRCEFKGLAIHACHKRDEHRGAGGDPSGERTQRLKIISMCERHHAWYDAFRLDVEPLDAEQLFDAACAFYVDGVHIGTEKLIGVSVTRSVR